MHDSDINARELRKEHAEDIRDIIDRPGLKAKDAMVKASLFNVNDEIEKIIKSLKKCNSDACQLCVVVDDEGRFYGEISIEDLTRIMAHTALKEPLVQILDTGYTRDLNWKTAGDVAKKHKNIVSEETPIKDILTLIYNKKFEYIIVTDRDEKVTGVITHRSLLRTLTHH